MASAACLLNGARSIAQLREHPLRGAVFETWVVDEVAKVRLHAGASGGLAFFRDRKGREVDLLVGDSGTLTAVETRSAQTVHQDCFAALAAFAELVEGERRPPSLRRVLVYGGVTRQQRSAATVLPWSAIHRYDWLEEPVVTRRSVRWVRAPGGQLPSVINSGYRYVWAGGNAAASSWSCTRRIMTPAMFMCLKTASGC